MFSNQFFLRLNVIFVSDNKGSFIKLMLHAYASGVKFTGPFYIVLSGLGEIVGVSFLSGNKSRKVVV